jgi:hypothetical protein
MTFLHPAWAIAQREAAEPRRSAVVAGQQTRSLKVLWDSNNLPISPD